MSYLAHLPLQDSLSNAHEFLLGPRYADSRVADWPLMGWEAPVFISCCCAPLYSMLADHKSSPAQKTDHRTRSSVILVQPLDVFGIPLGIWMMKDREPLKVKTFAMLHNLVLFLLSVYMAVECFRQSVANFGRPRPRPEGAAGFRLFCNPNDAYSPDGGDTFSESGLALARVLYVHYISKAYEFVDTFIMILKKNNRQITFLHVYHHATTFFPVWWAVMKYAPGGDAWFCCFLNSAIHVIMYGYYFCASIGLRLSFVKPLITLSQMIQFLAFLYQGSMILIQNCYRPRVSAVLLVVQCSVFFALFTNFFVKTYIMGAKKKPKMT